MSLSEKPEVEDIQAALNSWVERMTLRYGPVVWDQEDMRELTWVNALSVIRYTTTDWLLDQPLFAEEDLQYAFKMEQEQWAGDGMFWRPRWMPMAFRDTPLCTDEDHKFILTKASGDMSFRIVCVDACEQPIARYNRATMEYQWGACITVQTEWEDSYEWIDLDIPVLVHGTWNTETRKDGDHRYVDYWEIEPRFDSNSQVCKICGREIRIPFYARSRHDQKMKICSQCGRREALEDLPKLEV